MTPKAMRKQMKDYLVARLEGSDFNIEPVTKEIVSGIKSNYIRVGNKGLVLSIDQPYPGSILEKISNGMYNAGAKNIAFVFLKDGKNFFRSEAKNINSKGGRLSLNHYSPEEIYRTIFFRPEEKFVFEKRESILQYYQPQSGKLSEGIVSYLFRPTDLKYDHVRNREHIERFLKDRESKKDHIWDNGSRREIQGNLKLGKMALVERSEINAAIHEFEDPDRAQ